MADPIRVLHVDDDAEFAELAATFLERADDRLSVVTATDVETGLDRLEAGGIDCVVSDYEMPGRNGLEFLEAVRAAYPDLPFILFTAQGTDEVASEAISAGATDYCRKETGTAQYTVLANRIENAVERRRSERDADRFRRRLADLTENIPDCVWMFDAEWEELVFVSGYERVWGRSREGLEDDPLDFLQAVHPADRDLVEEVMEAASNGEANDVEYRIRRNGETGWVWVKCEPVVDEEGNVARIVGFTRDITERKTQERELERLTRRYRAYIENAMDVITVLEKDGTISYESAAIERVLGYEPDELIGENAFEYIHPDDRDRVLETFRSLTEKPADAEPDRKRIEYRFQHADGSWVWLESVTSGVIDTALDGYVVNSRKISERKDRERTLSALHAAARRIGGADEPAAVYEALTETAERILEFDLVAVDVERDGHLIQEAWTLEVDDRQYHARTSLKDDTFATRAYNRQETIVVDDLRESEITPADPEYRSALTIPIGEFGTFQTVSSDVEAFDRHDREFAELLVGHATVKLAQLQDKRALRERTDQLERQNERLDEFVSVVSHDLRNPVSVAKGNLELARSDGPETDEEHLEEVDWALDRIDGLIEDLLSLARNGEEIGERQRIDLESLTERCWRSVATADATLEVECDRELEADAGRLQQLFENLVRNAIDHGGNDVTVRIGDLEDEGFYIADDGPGIPESDRDSVFDVGYSTSSDGTGFGLYIVKQIVDAHGWDLRVTDSADGGARFEITDVEFAG
ncbi:PAS domain S-box-containing protein [Halobiforma haloterrestris]|uniref:histidine kinase n=1 Tax=Natronobacterium haloterrestre TaxID=148448 RepID=A0A1I1KQ78_NATHA|nr:PAS domain S-box protein [Halobiforma haloterrestris]SFC62947.1 PAS domain S-box-containing protein [Halobiforma haloterrestris]